MGRSPCCDKQGIKKGPWTPEEDKILIDYIQANGHGSWRSLPKLAGLLRCGKSCRLRWTNYLRPDIKRGPFTVEEDKAIVQLHAILGNKWSAIAAQLPGRTDNEVKNYWNTHLKKRLLLHHHRLSHLLSISSSSSPAAAASTTGSHMAQWESARLEAEARLSRESLLFSHAASAAAASSSSPAPAASDLDVADPLWPRSLEPDFFLRLWDSDVGAAFRRRTSSDAAASESKSCGTVGPPPVAAGGMMDVDSSGSNEVAADDTSEEAFHLYLDFAGDDLGMFHTEFSSLFYGNLNDAAFDADFK